MQRAGFSILHVTSFMAMLLPLMIASRIKKPKGKQNYIGREYQVSNILNTVFGGICTLERKIIEKGRDFPFGGSLLVIGVKNENSI
jgi:hypothetical protein